MRATLRGIAGAACALVLVVAAVLLTERSASLTSETGGGVRPVGVDVAEVTARLASVSDRVGREPARYDRVVGFGPAWQDVEGAGCDPRNRVLARDLVSVRHAADGCRVLSGILDDPYTDTRINFTRGVDTSFLVQIDHVVPLAYAWAHGAASWTPEERRVFANDPDVLLAVDGAANQAKSGAGPSAWMPPNQGYRCAYVAFFVRVLSDYQLSIDPADRAAIAHTLTTC